MAPRVTTPRRADDELVRELVARHDPGPERSQRMASITSIGRSLGRDSSAARSTSVSLISAGRPPLRHPDTRRASRGPIARDRRARRRARRRRQLERLDDARVIGDPQ